METQSQDRIHANGNKDARVFSRTTSTTTRTDVMDPLVSVLDTLELPA
jgi:hypothetical protein